MHPSEGLVRFVAKHDGLTAALGQKENQGLLQSRATRATFLAAPTPGMVFHYTPHHASWMNQSERWLSIWVRTRRKRASFPSVEELPVKGLAFLTYCNATLARPCTWTYGRQPLSI
jgi:hypothetical protein